MRRSRLRPVPDRSPDRDERHLRLARCPGLAPRAAIGRGRAVAAAAADVGAAYGRGDAGGRRTAWEETEETLEGALISESPKAI